jgi:hypothetical protein
VTENHGVAGSIPALGTILFLYIFSASGDASDIVIALRAIDALELLSKVNNAPLQRCCVDRGERDLKNQ